MLEGQDYRPLYKVSPFVAAFTECSMKYAKTAYMAIVGTRYSEVVCDVMEDME